MSETDTKPRRGAKAKAVEEPPQNGLETIAAGTAGPASGDDEPPLVVEPPSEEDLNGQLGSLKDAIDRDQQAELKGVDLTGEGQSAALERMLANAEATEVDIRSLIPDARDLLLQAFKDRNKPWQVMRSDEQRDLAAGLEQLVTDLARKIVEAIRSGGAVDPIRCLLVGYTDKGDDIKVDLKVKALDSEATTAAVLGLHKAKGKHVLVTVASVDDYRGEEREAEIDDDEPPLDFEAGGPEHPADDSDLAGEDGESGGLVHGVNRVNLKTGMFQTLADGLDPDVEDHPDEAWEDVRDATPEELAAERERTADFDAD